MAHTYDIGQEVWAEAYFTVAGQPAIPDTITLTWRKPDGDVTAYGIDTLELVEPGRYRKSFALDAAGIFVANWVSTGDGASSDEKVFVVSPRSVDGYLLAFYGANPTAEPRDQVRLLVGDTNPHDYLLLDAEVDWVLARAGDDVEAAAIKAALAIAAKFGREVDRSLGDVSRSASQRSAAYRALAKAMSDQAALDREAAVRTSAPLALANNLDCDPYFALGFMDRPGTTRPFGGAVDPRAGL